MSSLRISASMPGASAWQTEAGPPERMIPLAVRASAALIVCGTISQ